MEIGTASADIFAVGGSITDTELKTAACKNVTTGLNVTIKLPKGSTSWDCGNALPTRDGEAVKVTLTGITKKKQNPEVPINGLVAYYPFNGNANDESGNGNNGVGHGGIALTTDRFGNQNSAYHFNGGDGYILVNNSSSLDLTSAGTITVWYKADPDMNYNVYGYPHLLSKGATYGVLWADYALHTYPANNLTSEFTPDSNSRGELEGLITNANVWTQVTVTYNSGDVSLYENGILISKGSAPTPIRISTQPLYIGHRYDTVNSGAFKGSIDDIRIYNRYLSPDEVATNYNVALQETQNK